MLKRTRPRVRHYCSLLVIIVSAIRAHCLPSYFRRSMKAFCSAKDQRQGRARGCPLLLKLLMTKASPCSALILASSDPVLKRRTFQRRASSESSPFTISSLMASIFFWDMYRWRYLTLSLIILFRISNFACFLSPLLLFLSSRRIRNGSIISISTSCL